jgi:hypothetical protein
MYLGYVYPWVCIIVSKTYVFEAWCLDTLVSHISFLYISLAVVAAGLVAAAGSPLR